MTRWTLILLIFLTACAIKNPPYKDTDLIEVPELIGDWVYADTASQENRSILTLSKMESKQYLLYSSYIKTAFIAKFFRLNDEDFMSLQLTDEDFMSLQLADFENEFKPECEEGYFVWKIIRDSTLLKFVPFNTDYLIKLTREKKLQLSYEVSYGQSSCITEPTDKLQKLIIEYTNDQNAFSDQSVITLKRK